MLFGETSASGAWGYGNEFFGREAWRFVAVQEQVFKLALTAVDFPPMQDPASFNLEAVKKQIETMIKAREGQ
jgi:arylsulfatase